MVYRKGELTKARINRDWPHQLALPVEVATGKNYTILDRFCRGLSVCPRQQHYWRDGVEHIAYCFRERSDAEYVQMYFGGEFVDPNDSWALVEIAPPTTLARLLPDGSAPKSRACAVASPRSRHPMNSGSPSSWARRTIRAWRRPRSSAREGRTGRQSTTARRAKSIGSSARTQDRRAHTGSAVVGSDPVLEQGEKGGRKPINAKAETVATLPTFRDAYKLRRCIVPIDNFFEWKAIKGAKAKQPYAIAMQDRSAVRRRGHLGELEAPGTEDWVRTFCSHHVSSQ